jgi:hypothetical protein
MTAFIAGNKGIIATAVNERDCLLPFIQILGNQVAERLRNR